MVYHGSIVLIFSGSLSLVKSSGIPSPNQFTGWTNMPEWSDRARFQLTRANWKYQTYPIIQNLDSLLSQFTSKHCHVALDNPRWIDLILTNPVILRPDIPHVRPTLNYTAAAQSCVEAYLETAQHRYLRTTAGIRHLLESKQDACNLLNWFRNWHRRTLGLCLVEICIYPTISYYGNLKYYPKGMESLHKNPLLHMNTISSSLIIFVHEETDEEFQLWWQSHSEEPCQYIIAHLTVRQKPVLQRLVPNVGKELGNISTAKILQPCYISGSAVTVDLKILAEIEKLSKLTFQRAGDKLVIGITHDVLGQDLMSHVTKMLLNHALIRSTRTVFNNPVEKVANAYAEIWQQIIFNHSVERYEEFILDIRDASETIPHSATNMMQEMFKLMGSLLQDNNWTLILSTFERMAKGMKKYATFLHLRPYLNNFHFFPYNHPQNRLSSFRFISCGERGQETFRFGELISVFDTWVWCLLFLQGVLVTIALAKFAGAEKDLMSTFKVLVEQSNPFPEKTARMNALRVVMGSFLLMGIVLSNAYKNKNVYNMIAPRDPSHETKIC